ncbi:MAG: membrane protein insertase YidC [Calditrichaeota bacterium]|nr:membrane protein insertase YidC [Calditrichota bacterium]
MDKKSLFAMLLIAVILLLLPYYQEYILGIKPDQEQYVKQDSVLIPDKTNLKKEDSGKKVNIEENSKKDLMVPSVDIYQNDSLEKTITIETVNYIVKLSNRGGGSLKDFILKKYTKYDSSLVNMISDNLKNNLTLTFQETGGSYIDTKNYIYNASIKLEKKKLLDNEEYKIVYTLDYNGSEIKKEFTFFDNAYHIDLDISFSNPGILLNNQYQINWINGLPSTESYVEDDNQYSQAFAYMGGELEDYSISDPGETEVTTFSGNADWIAIRTKYFITSVSVLNANVSNGIYFKGLGIEHENYTQKLYNTGFYAQYNSSRGDDSYRIFIGPLDNKELGKYDNNLDELIMNNGAYERFFRPVSKLILPILEFFHSFIPNWGVVIIIFSILVKLIVYPLTKKSYQSTKKMQVLQPKMAEIREKYKNDPQRMNKEMMKLYQQHGSPLSGCLPMLLQMPLLLALYIVFRSTIQLRGAVFIPGWIDDLSRADTLFTLPFSIPLYGADFNLLPILMALTMFFQSKMTMQDPKQKAMIYIMPVFMLAIFNRFPSGLNLYYTMFNLLTIIQQRFIKSDDKEDDKSVKGLKQKGKGK